MAGSRKTTLILLVIAIPLVVLAGTVVALRLYFNEGRLKELILPRLEAAARRPVTLDRVSLSVIPRITVNLEGLTIANRPGQGFTMKPMVSLEELVFALDFFPLLKGDVRISTMSFRRPHILLEVNSNGFSNYSEPDHAGGTPGGEQNGTGGGILIADAQITHGRLEYLNHKENTATVLEGVNYTIEVEAPRDAPRIKIEGTATVDDFSYGSVSSTVLSGLHLTMEHSLLYTRESDSLIIERGTGSVNGMPLLISGFFADVSSETPHVDLIVTGDNLSITDLFSLIPREYMSSASGLQGEGNVQVRVQTTGTLTDSTRLSVAGQIASTNARAQFTGFPQAISNITIAADFERSPNIQRFRMNRFSATLGENPVHATMTLVHFDDPILSMTVDGTINLAQVKDFYPLEQGISLSGVVRAKLNLDGKIGLPSAMKATGSLVFRDVAIAAEEQSVDHLNGAVTVNNAVIQSNNLAMIIGSSDLNLSFLVRNYLTLLAGEEGSSPPTASITLTSRHLRTEDILTNSSSPEQTPSHAQSPAGVLPFPSVTMDISASIRTFTMEKLTLENVRSSMRVAGGKVTLNDFSCNAFGGTILTRGELNLQEMKRPRFGLSLDMSNVNGHMLLSEFTSFGSRIFGAFSMQSTMRGALDDTLGLRPETLEGQGTIRISEGKLVGIQVNKAIASRLSLPSLEEIAFSDWSNTFTIRDGRFQIKDLTIRGSQADYTVNGSQGLDGTLDYTLGLVLPREASDRVMVAGFAGDALNMFKDTDGRFRFDFGVTGTTDNPEVALQTDAARRRLEEIARQKITEESKRLKDQAKKKGEELLDKLLKKK